MKETNDQPTEVVASLIASGRRLATSLDGKLAFFDLPERGCLVIGRSGEADLTIEHASISRRHVALHLAADVVKVEDLGSANGTSLGGRRLTKGTPEVLPPGVALELGTLLLTLQDGRAPAHVDAKPSDDAVIADPVMIEVLETVRIAAGSSLSVLLLGETGSGKEVFARRVHDLSPRRKMELLKVNCAALVESLLEAELFGYERGAFTGATHAKPGLLEVASGGTLFLDEIGEMPLSTQAKLLRVLESGEVTRVGALKPQTVDVRFVSATHRDLTALVSAGRFREDLFFRLEGVTIRIPPLRERVVEIEPLAKSFVLTAALKANKSAPSISPGALERLVGHRWPGNVRELRNVIQRSVLFCSTTTLEAGDLRFDAQASTTASREVQGKEGSTKEGANTSLGAGSADGLSAERLERRVKVLAALEAALWNQTRAAEQLGISRRTLHSWMTELRIPRSRGQR